MPTAGTDPAGQKTDDEADQDGNDDLQHGGLPLDLERCDTGTWSDAFSQSRRSTSM
jgi:hypothetical protein